MTPWFDAEELAFAWAEEHWPEYEIHIVYMFTDAGCQSKPMRGYRFT